MMENFDSQKTFSENDGKTILPKIILSHFIAKELIKTIMRKDLPQKYYL